MKSIGNKVLVFYYFQLESNRDYNVTYLASRGQPPTIKQLLTSLPFDLSHGRYHFRFKSQLTDGDQKVIGWIDINNIMAKVPQINNCIYVKILQLKDPNHNKLFNLDKLKKAQIIKINSNHQNLSKGSPSPRHSTSKPPVIAQPAINNPIVNNSNPVELIKNITPTNVASPTINLLPQKPKLNTTTTQENVQTFNNQFKVQQQNRENERIAQGQLQDRIRKWGYTDGKKINNTTTLLATLHQIWPQWDQVSLTDMLKPEQVNSLFKKAVIKVHPDKNRNRHFKQKYLSKRVFELLNQSRKQS